MIRLEKVTGDKMLLSQRYKTIYFLRIWQKRLLRRMELILDSNKYCSEKKGQLQKLMEL